MTTLLNHLYALAFGLALLAVITFGKKLTVTYHPDARWYIEGDVYHEVDHPAHIKVLAGWAQTLKPGQQVWLYTPTVKDPLLRAWVDEVGHLRVLPLREPVGDKRLDWTAGANEGLYGDRQAGLTFMKHFLGIEDMDLEVPDYPDHPGAWKRFLGVSKCWCNECYCHEYNEEGECWCE